MEWFETIVFYSYAGQKWELKKKKVKKGNHKYCNPPASHYMST